MARLLSETTYRRLIQSSRTIERAGSGLTSVPGAGIGVLRGVRLAERLDRQTVPRLLWVKITGNETGGGKYQGKSYTHDGTSDVAATGNLAESELGTLASAVDCRVLNFAEEGQSTHDLTSGTPKVDTFLCHWFRTNSDGIKVCAVVAIDWEVCT